LVSGGVPPLLADQLGQLLVLGEGPPRERSAHWTGIGRNVGIHTCMRPFPHYHSAIKRGAERVQANGRTDLGDLRHIGEVSELLLMAILRS
jgi:hypothetical protein